MSLKGYFVQLREYQGWPTLGGAEMGGMGNRQDKMNTAHHCSAAHLIEKVKGVALRRYLFVTFQLVCLLCCNQLLGQQTVREQLWAATRNGDATEISRLLDSGADVNATNEIGLTALWIAAGKGNLEIVKLLIDRGADVNARDGIWYQTPLSSAVRGKSDEIIECLLKAGASDIEDAAKLAAMLGNGNRLKMMLDTGRVGQEVLDALLYSTKHSRQEVIDLISEAGAKPLPEASESERQRWMKLAGKYDSDNGGVLELSVEPVGLVIKSMLGSTPLKEAAPDFFNPIGSNTGSIRVERSGDTVVRIIQRRFTAESVFYPMKEFAAVKPTATERKEVQDDQVHAQYIDWPQFRGPNATGVVDGQLPPLIWNVKTGENIKWKTPIPGLGHSCPVVSAGRVFLTTAVSGDPEPKLRIGNYGDVGSVDDRTEHSWHVLCLDAESGTMMWNQEVHRGIPKIKRHLKGSQANCTAAIDGKHVVACFGSEGLYCLDFDGNLVWSRDLSTIDSSFAMDEEYEWGFAGSPVIHDGKVFVQFDLSRDSFIAAYSLLDGSKIWETARDEIPSWSSPTLWHNSGRIELVTNASQFARSYDPETGEELWRLAKKSEATIPAPVPHGDLMIICSGNRPIQPIFAIKPGASGDISLQDGQSSNDFIAWSMMRGGPYMPTPVAYDGLLYVCSNAGVLTCYDLANGAQVYRERLGGKSYTASPVASDDRIYFVAENGEVRVVKAGPVFELLAENTMDDICMAVPAISGGKLFIRSQHFLFAIQRGAGFSSHSGEVSGSRENEDKP